MLGARGSGSSGDNARMFNQVLQHVSRDFVDTLGDTAVYRRAIEGLVEELHDPHSSYLSPKLFKSLNERTTGRYAGVGAQVDVRDRAAVNRAAEEVTRRLLVRCPDREQIHLEHRLARLARKATQPARLR